MIFFSSGAMATVFVACELGQRISNASIEINDVFDQFNWYLFPVEIQRILPTAILYVQQPIEVKFFGSSSCSREQAKRVSFYKIHVPHIHDVFK